MATRRWMLVAGFAGANLLALGCSPSGPNRGGPAARTGTRTVPGGGAAPASGDNESGGEVASATDATASTRWLDDGNVLALVDTIAAQQMDAAKLELQAWHSDTVRSLATAALDRAAALQHSADSLAAVIRVAPVTPAIAANVSARLQAARAALAGLVGTPMDRAFIAEQVASHGLAASYLGAMSAIAERPEVQALAARAASDEAQQGAAVQLLQSQIARSDSITAADSASARAARRPGG